MIKNFLINYIKCISSSPTNPLDPTIFKAILSARMEGLPWAMSTNGLV